MRAFEPPQGLLAVAAYVRERRPRWEARFVDENVARATGADFDWADAVFTTGMRAQRNAILDVNERAHRHGRLPVLGGPSVSASRPRPRRWSRRSWTGSGGAKIRSSSRARRRPTSRAAARSSLRALNVHGIEVVSGIILGLDTDSTRTGSQPARRAGAREPRPRLRPGRGRARGARSGGASELLGRILWRVGVRADYRDAFWRLARPALRAGRISRTWPSSRTT